MKLTDIASGWFNFIAAPIEHQQMIHFRLAICDKCPSKRQLSPMGKTLVEALNKEGSTFYCKECGCPLAGKTAAPQSTCPLSKWTYWIKPETHY